MPLIQSSAVVWKPLAAPNSTIPSKPAKGVKVGGFYGRQIVRTTDHTADAGTSKMRNDYSRRQPYNCNNTRIFLYGDGGAWHLYDCNTYQHIKQLVGPGGDAEMQWDPKNPNLLYYMDSNGGSVIRTLDVATDVRGVAYDFKHDVDLALGTTDWEHAWTRSEGSPSRDGKLWGLLCQHYNSSTGNFDSRGYVVIDIVNRRVVWSKPTTSDDRPDHVSITPCGRWFAIDGGSNPNVYIIGVAADNLNQVRTLNRSSEHSDFFVLPNGHSGYFSIDYNTNNGDLFWIDCEDPLSTRQVITHAYNNVFFPQDYTFHFSGKAYNKPGWIVGCNENVPCRNLFLINVATRKLYGVSLTYALHGDGDDGYWDEVHACPNRDLTRIAFNDNYNHPGDVDTYQAIIPPLPTH